MLDPRQMDIYLIQEFVISCTRLAADSAFQDLHFKVYSRDVKRTAHGPHAAVRLTPLMYIIILSIHSMHHARFHRNSGFTHVRYIRLSRHVRFLRRSR